MKKLLLCASFFLLSWNAGAQSDTTVTDTTTFYKITYQDGEEIVVRILDSNSREIFVVMEDQRRIHIPQYVIKEMKRLPSSSFDKDDKYVPDDPFATRYFITTNGIPLRKGESYVQWNIYGPDFQFSLTDELGVGIMTSWIGVPIVANMKYTLLQNKNIQLALGFLAGTGSWSSPGFGGVLPFATVSIGDRRSNVSLSGGYGSIWSDGDQSGRTLLSIAAMTRLTGKISLVFDSFILLPKESEYIEYMPGIAYEKRRPGMAILIPGIRWHTSEESAFQFGFSGLALDEELVPLPIPMAQWFKRL